MAIWDTGIPESVSLTPLDLEAPLGFAPAPVLQSLSATTIPGLSTAYFTSPYYLSDDQVKNKVLETIAKVVTANNFNTTVTPKFASFHNHSPYWVTAGHKAVRDGFYSRLNGLQGQKNTFYTGAAWQTHDSSLIWDWSERILLPMVIESIH